MLNSLVHILKQITCKHNYIKQPDLVLDKCLRNDKSKGTSYSYSRLHVCKKCGKEKIIGSGQINY